MRRGTKVSGTNENPLLEGTRKRKMEDGKRERGKRKTEEKIKKREENEGIVFCSLDVDTRGLKFHPLVVHSNMVGNGGEGERRKKRRRIKKNIFLRLCTLFTQIYDRWLRHR